jgi:predicted esterase
VTREAIGPLTFGWVRPTVVIPEALAAHRSVDELEPLLAHELVHVRRGDALVGLFQIAMQCLWWFHPLIWWANRRIVSERERCCDEEVVASLAFEPARYARSLLGVLELKQQLRWPASAPGTRSFEINQHRLEHIMLRGDRFQSRMPRGCWLTLIVLALLLVPGASLTGLSGSIARSADKAQSNRLPELELQTDKAKSTQLIPTRSADNQANLADAELHVIGVYGAKDSLMTRADNRGRVDVEVRRTAKPVVLVLTSYYSVEWHIKLADGARVKKAIVAGYYAQKIQGLPAAVPVVNRSYFSSDLSIRKEGYFSIRKEGYFWAYKWNTLEYRRMVETLNNMTGLLVSTFQGAQAGTSFVVDGARGRNFAQKERKRKLPRPKEPTPQELLAVSANADLHVVGIYDPGDNGAPVDVDVRPAAKPIVLVLTSYMSVLWRVKIAPGAHVKAVIIGGYYEQEFEGIPGDIPLVYCAYFPSLNRGFSYGYKSDTPEYLQMVQKLNDMTGLLVSTFQGAERGTSFVVDGTRGRDLAQKERTVGGTKGLEVAKKQPKAEEDPSSDVADIPSQERQAAGDASKRCYLIGPKKDAKPPVEGYGLVVIMPGGDGSAEFHPFVKRIYKYALSDRYVAAQPVAVQWTPEQEIVWPTTMNPAAKMKFSTEQFVEAVIEDVAKRHKLDRTRVFSISWSSSGPAAYAVSLQDKHSVTGSFIAMSVFHPQFLPPLKEAKGRAYYLYHSPQDRVCPYRMAEQAKNSLLEHGAKVRLETYAGGHGWRGDVYNDILNGIEWLGKNQETASRP